MHHSKDALQPITTAVVVGAGVMGHGIAQLLATNGITVRLIDRAPEFLERGKGWIQDNLNYMVELGEIEASAAASSLAHIHFTTDLTDSLAGAGYVLEAVTENFDLKREIWKILGQCADAEAVLASNTSSYDINELAKDISHPQRILGTHWFHPPPITPCVEVIPSTQTSQSCIDAVMAFLISLGKVPTICKSAPGFVANRLQMALAAEAIALVEEGLAAPAEVDRIVKTSFGFRLGAYGPFEIMDQAGADTYLSIFEYLTAKLGKPHFKPPRLLADQVRAGRLGLKTSAGFYDYGPGAANAMRRERDRKYYSRLKLFRQESTQDK